MEPTITREEVLDAMLKAEQLKMAEDAAWHSYNNAVMADPVLAGLHKAWRDASAEEYRARSEAEKIQKQFLQEMTK